jgi:hypothetical protein
MSTYYSLTRTLPCLCCMTPCCAVIQSVWATALGLDDVVDDQQNLYVRTVYSDDVQHHAHDRIGLDSSTRQSSGWLWLVPGMLVGASNDALLDSLWINQYRYGGKGGTPRAERALDVSEYISGFNITKIDVKNNQHTFKAIQVTATVTQQIGNQAALPHISSLAM